MRLFHHYGIQNFSNSYVLGPAEGGDAIIVDPGSFDLSSLNIIEKNNLYIRSVLITHMHDHHIQGLRTLKKIYDSNIYAFAPEVCGFKTVPLHDGERFRLGGMDIQVLMVQGHSKDSLMFQVEHILFTGDVLQAGSIGSTPNAFTRTLMVAKIKDHFKRLPPDTLVLPGHGPPSRVRLELEFNPGLNAPIPKELSENRQEWGY